MKLKEPLQGFLHLLGILGGIAALVLLLVFGHDSPWKVVSFSLYGASIIILYTASTLYHWLPKEAGGKNQIFRKIDHLSIYFLIAGSYTPFCLLPLRGPWGWSLFGVIWGLAIIGILTQAIYINVWRWLTTTIYLLMGWIIVIAIKPLLSALPLAAFYWLLAGGIIYSIGGVIYTIKKPNFHHHFNYHSLWHIFVLLGSLCHFVVVFFFLAL
jgi:hemolysin III